MKKLFVVGNWKANKTRKQAEEWIATFNGYKLDIPDFVTVILCPAYHHLDLFLSRPLPISLGVQDISPFPAGAYTGEIAATMVERIVHFVMVGHSERRKYFKESDEIVARKVEEAMSASIRPIVCVSELAQAANLMRLTPMFPETGILLYEPLFAIGSGSADTPENANATAEKLHDVVGDVPILYGGSVSPENVQGFFQQKYLHGIGAGGASLDPEKFYRLIEAASHAT